MGLFSFLKDIGKKPDEGKDLREVLGQAVTKAGLNVKNFKVDFRDGVASLFGQAATLKDLELARLLVGNYKGVEKVNDDGLTLAPAAHASQAQADGVGTTAAGTARTQNTKPARMITVRPGDTLSKLARDYMGNANLYHELFEANRPMLKDPDEIFPGQVLRVPEVQGPQPSPGARA